MPAIVLENLVWCRYGLEGNGKVATHWWPAIYFESHSEGLDDAYASLKHSNAESNDGYNGGYNGCSIDFGGDPAIEAQLTCNVLQETLNPAMKIPMLSLFLPHRNKKPAGPDFFRRHIPMNCIDESSIKRDFLNNLLEIMKIQTEKELGSNYPAYQASLRHMKYIIASSASLNSVAVTFNSSAVTTETRSEDVSYQHQKLAEAVSLDDKLETKSSSTQIMTLPETQDMTVVIEATSQLEDQLPDIDSMESWADVWVKLQFSGWYIRSTNSLNDETSYVRNHMKENAVENVDYFKSLEAVQDFLRRKCNWQWTPELEKQMTEKKRPQKTTIKGASKVGRKTKSTVARVSIAPGEISDPRNTSINNAPQLQTTPENWTKPQDPGKPILTDGSDSRSNASSLSSRSSLNSSDRYVWKIVKDRLKDEKWTIVKAKNNLDDWYYVRPCCTIKSGVLGKDFFANTTDVINFLKQQDSSSDHHPGYYVPRSKGTSGLKPSRLSKSTTVKHKNADNEVPRKRLKLDDSSRDVGSVKNTPNPLNDSNTLHRTDNIPSDRSQQSVPSRADTYVSNHSADVSQNSKFAKSRSSSKEKKHLQELHWWKSEAMPSSNDIYPILCKLGYYKVDDKIHLPKIVESKYKMKHTPQFKSLSGLRKYLCWKGIPDFDDSGKALSKWELEQLIRWVRFANVPVEAQNSIERLSSVSSPKNDTTLLQLLFKLKFSPLDGKIFVPFADRLGREKRVHKKHFFHEHELRSELRAFVRRSWHLGLTPTETNSTSNARSSDSLCFLANAKPLHGLSRNVLLQVSLWGATSSEELPKFQNGADGLNTQYLEELLDSESYKKASRIVTQPTGSFSEVQSTAKKNELEDSNKGVNSSKQKSMNTSESSKIKDITQPKCNFSEVQSATNNEPEDSKEGVSSIKQQLKGTSGPSRMNESPWYKTEDIADFKVIWPILIKLGFTWSSGKYSHPLYPRDKFQTCGKSLQSFLCEHGIPNFETASEKLKATECTVLQRWVSFANVPNDALRLLENLKIPDTLKVRSLLLSKFEFQIRNDKFYPPGAIPGNKELTPGVHFFEGMDTVRDFIRGSSDLRIAASHELADQNRRRRTKPLYTLEELLIIRVWAALSPSPLPTFTLAFQPSTNAATNDDSCSTHNADGKLVTDNEGRSSLLLDTQEESQASNDIKQSDGHCSENESYPSHSVPEENDIVSYHSCVESDSVSDCLLNVESFDHLLTQPCQADSLNGDDTVGFDDLEF